MQRKQFKGKSSATEMWNISMGLVFKYHYSGDVALKKNFDKQEKESIMQMCVTVCNSLGYVTPIYKQM